MKYFDELKYSICGDDFVINQYLKIQLPTVREVSDFGENTYFQLVSLFIRKPYDIAVELDDKGLNYQNFTDWDIFFDTVHKIPMEYSRILFGDVNFQKFGRYIDPETGLKRLVNSDDMAFVIDEVIYHEMTKFLRFVHFESETVEYDMGNEAGRRFLIDRMRRKKKKAQRDYESGRVRPQSTLSNMVKYCVNNSNFKYDYSSVLNLRINLLYESYYQISHANERNNVLSGIYHGTIDVQKMKDKSILDIIPDLHK